MIVIDAWLEECDPMEQQDALSPARATQLKWSVRIAFVAFSIGMFAWGLRMWHLSTNYTANASLFAELELEAKLSFRQRDEAFAGLDRESRIASIGPVSEAARSIGWLKQMRLRYEHAASHPWEPPPLDPQAPN
jgi:hypothetical protein